MSATSAAGLSDEVAAELNPTEAPPAEGQPARIPNRPADGASKEKWGAYVVALGLHRDELVHYTRSELIDLAARLGG